MLGIARAAGIVLVGLLVVAVPACAPKEPPPPEEPPPPPPPTPEELAQKLIGELGLDAPLPGANARVTPEEAQKLKQGIQRAKAQHTGTPDGKRVLQLLSNKLDDRISALEAAQRWEHVILMIDAFEALNPGSLKWLQSKEVATAEMRKPRVTIVGFLTTQGQDSAILEFYLPIQRTTEREQVRVGEEFYGLKLLEIIGNNQGVRFEYLETGDVFDVLKE
jgi:hypothetical protein